MLKNLKGILKFYPVFCELFKDGDMFPALGTRCNVLLGFDLANGVLSFVTKSKIFDNELCLRPSNIVNFGEKEKSIVFYISGYVASTMYRRIRFGKQKGEYYQQCLSFLMACKYVEGSETNIEHQNFATVKDRGALWKVNINAFNIFLSAESYFLENTKEKVTSIFHYIHQLFIHCFLFIERCICICTF